MKVLILVMMVLSFGCEGLKDKGLPGELNEDVREVFKNSIEIYKGDELVYFNANNNSLIQDSLSFADIGLGDKISIELNGNINKLNFNGVDAEISGQASINELNFTNSTLSGDISNIKILNDPEALFSYSDIRGLSGIETVVRSNHTSLLSTFDHATLPLGFDLSKIDTSNIKNFRRFLAGVNLNNISGVDTLNVSSAANLSGIFTRGSGTVDISSWDTSRVTSISRMFADFNGDVSGLDAVDLIEVEYINCLFCNADLTRIQGASNLSLPSLKETGAMLRGASGNIDLSGLNMSQVTHAHEMFKDFTGSFTGISGWDVSNVWTFREMFKNVAFSSSLMSWNMSNATDLTGMFEGADYNLDGITSWDTGKVEHFNKMFKNSTFNHDISAWSVSNKVSSHEFATGGALGPSFYPTF